MKVIFVAGIHAVGKSSACAAVSDELCIPYYTASQIIREENAEAIAENSKLVADVNSNQKLLIQGVSKRLDAGHFLLDGHFTMRRKLDNCIEAIHVDVFRELRIVGVVLFTDHPEKISKRRHERDGEDLPVDMYREHQEAEVPHAKYVASTLGTPIVILSAFDKESMVTAIKNWVDSAA